MTSEERIRKALEIAHNGAIDGAHHKMYIIDQMVRALTGCPMVTRTDIDHQGNPYSYDAQGESEEYLAWVAAYCDGEEGPNTYAWYTGDSP